MRGVIAFATAAVIAVSLASQNAPQDAPKSDVEPAAKLEYFMARKLVHSQSLFGALAVNDLAAASQEAQKLGLLCLDEGWNVVATPEYAERTAAFRRTIGAIDRAAKKKDLAAAQLEWLALAGQCFSCHQHVRDARALPASEPEHER